MTCFHPLTAYRVRGGGRLTFDGGRADVVAEQLIPCGQCFGCRRDRAMRWGIRCMHEASLYPGPFSSSFITLTYRDENIPDYRSLKKEDSQHFIKKLRNEIYPAKVRFFMAGEYSPYKPDGSGLRPHYHGLIFGFGFDDRKYWKKSVSGKLYRSDLLEKCWPHGNALLGAVTFESAAYTARYCMKKLNGDLGREAYRVFDPLTGLPVVDPETGELISREKEFAHMSTHPGIGAAWLAKYKRQTFAWDFVVVNGKKSPVPGYYDRLFEREDPDKLALLKYERQLRALDHAEDCTPERLKVREACAKAKAAFFEAPRG
jgi:hypothetical protein